MTRFILILIFSWNTFPGLAQQVAYDTLDVPTRYARTITAGELKDYLTVIAADSMEGRETGEPGQKRAAQYIAAQLEIWNLPKVGEEGSYFQKMFFTSENWQTVQLTVNGEKARNLWDFYAFPSANTDLDTSAFNEVLFLGYGIEDEHYDDYEGVDVTGKTILIFAGEPLDRKGYSRVSKSDTVSSWSTDWRRKIRLARQKGAAAVLIIDPAFKKNVAEARREIVSRQRKLGKGEEPERYYVSNYFVSTSLAEKIIGKEYKKVVKARRKIRKGGRLKPVVLPCRIQLYQEKNIQQLTGENILAYIEGADEALKEEIVLITAHYDHIGRRGETIFNGADDNGSGTSSLLEICEAFLEAKKDGEGPRRSVLIMWVSGEEKGLLGSDYYTQKPVFPLEKTIVNINIDMVGRVDKKHENNPNYIYVIGADRLSSDLHRINEQVNQQYTRLELDYTYNAENDPNRFYYRSDHYNFARLGIPAVFYFNGTHPDYHRSTDTVEKINFEKMEKVVRLIFHTAWELANRDERIRVDVSGKN